MISNPRERSAEADREAGQRGGDATAGGGIDLSSILAGLKGGLVGTAAMTVFRMPVSDSLPPTARFYAKFIGSGEPDDYPLQALVLHLLYGTGGGALFGALPIPDRDGSTASNERRGTLVGAVFGVALSVFGEYAILRGLLDMDPEPDERFIFHVGHLIYGLALGATHGSEMSQRNEERRRRNEMHEGGD